MARHIRTLLLAISIASLAFLTGCPQPSQGLVQTMDEFGFTAMNPPTAGWEAGAIVEVKNQRFLPQPILFPSAAGISMPAPWVKEMPAPDVSRTHDHHLNLGVGASIPDWLSAKIQAEYENVSKYSVVASGNRLIVVHLIDYYPAFQQMVAYAKSESPPNGILPYVEAGHAAWFSQLWLADSLEYRFYDKNDLAIDLEIPLEIPLDASFGWEQTNEGTLIYKGEHPVCLGYLPRPITPEAASGTGALQLSPFEVLMHNLSIDIGLKHEEFQRDSTLVPMSWGGVEEPAARALIR